MSVLQIEDLCKSFPGGFLGRRHVVLSNLSLSIERGEAFGLLGQNGAGKTTTMRLIVGLLRSDSGRIRLFGGDGSLHRYKDKIGFLSDDVGLYPNFTADEMMQLTGELFGMERNRLRARKDELLDLLGLTERSNVKVKKYSKGMRQRLGIALAILNDPELLILDEPYSGLDPIGRRQIRELLLSLKAQGKTILLSSHIVPDVEAVCDRVGILRDGRVQQCLALRDIYEQKSTTVEITVGGLGQEACRVISPGAQVVYSRREATVLRCDGRKAVKRLVARVYELGGEVLEIKPLKFSLEDYLLEALIDNVRATPGARERKEKAYAHS